VQQARREHVAVGHAGPPQRGDDVEPVAPIGNVHGVEQLQLRGPQPRRQRGALCGAHAREQVRTELAGLTRPPGHW